MSDKKQLADNDATLAVTSDYKGQVVFGGESAGYKNAVGMYTYAADGTVSNVSIVWANASQKNDGGDLIAGKSAVDVGFQAGARVGFFVIPNGFGQDTGKLLADSSGSFKLVDAKGNPGSVHGGVELKLVHVDTNGQEVAIKSAFGTSIFHTTDDGTKGLNGDAFDHVSAQVDVAAGLIKYGFEDIKSGGDKDFNDLVVTIDVGTANAKHIADGTAEAMVERALAELVETQVAVTVPEATTASIALGAELLVDGSFEQAKVGANTWGHQKVVGGWTSDTEVEVWGKGFYGIKAAEGDKFAELDFDGKQSNIYQNVVTEAGAEYTFSFDYAKRSDSKAGSDTINVYWNGEFVGSVDPTSTAWSKAEFKVIGTGGDDRIEFRESAEDNNSYGGLLDNVSLLKSGLSAVEQSVAAVSKVVTEVVVAEPVVEVIQVVDVLTLETADVTKTITSEILIGSDLGEEIVGGMGNDELQGMSGDDRLIGDTGGRVTAALAISVTLVDVDNSETLSIIVGNMPASAVLSAGTDNGDGTWSVSPADLAGLTITADDGANFALTVTATATDVTGAVMTQAGTINVTFDSGNQDLMAGGGGNDHLTGGAGDDVMYGGSAPTGNGQSIANVADNDVVHGNDGDDVVFGNHGNDSVFGDAGNDKVSGGRGDDLVSGGDGDDVVKGNSGNDIITGDAGDDQITGGSGFDTLDYSMSGAGLVVDMSAKTATGMGSDTIRGIEKVIGSSFDDTIIGNGQDNVFEGGAGNDNIRGNKGNDTLTGGDGNDTFAFTKSDVFNVKSQTGWVDTITDFSVGDTLDLSGFFAPNTLNVADRILATDGVDGTTISVKFAGKFHDVVVLDGVHGVNTNDLMKEGMLFVA